MQVVVTIPEDDELRRLIHKMVEFVVKEGPPFEAIIMNREYHNPAFRFLLDYSSPEVCDQFGGCPPSKALAAICNREEVVSSRFLTRFITHYAAHLLSVEAVLYLARRQTGPLALGQIPHVSRWFVVATTAPQAGELVSLFHFSIPSARLRTVATGTVCVLIGSKSYVCDVCFRRTTTARTSPRRGSSRMQIATSSRTCCAVPQWTGSRSGTAWALRSTTATPRRRCDNRPPRWCDGRLRSLSFDAIAGFAC